MNILILFSQPWRVGGAETHVEALLKGFAEHKLFLVINEGSHEEKVKKLKEKFLNTTIIKIQSRGTNIFRWKRELSMLNQLIEREHIDIISAQQRTAGIWAYFLSKSKQIPFTVTMHDPWHRALFKSIYSTIFPKMFVVSQNLEDKLIREFGFARENVNVINNGIDFTTFVPKLQNECREKLGLNIDDQIILHVSRLSNVKGAVSLAIIESMRDVLEHKPNAKLVIIGEGPMRDEINKKIVKFNQIYGDKIAIYDFVDNIIDWYNATDILVGEGRVAMEALACLKPVVAIRNADFFIGAIKSDNIQYACDVNFDGKDQKVIPKSMAKEIEIAFLLQQSENKQIAEYIKDRLSIERMAAAYLNVFKSMYRKEGSLQ